MWICKLQHITDRLSDEYRKGLPITAMTPGSVDTVSQVIVDDCHEIQAWICASLDILGTVV